MRRQIKPFVTEYRANGRKARDTQPSHRDSARQASPSWLQEATASADNHGAPLTFEAAMRAADALFTRREPESASPGRPAAKQERAIAPEPGPTSAPRRILESLEPSSPASIQQSSDPEFGQQPKRRGRKPGSKNKPKLVPIVPSAETSIADLAPIETVAVAEPQPTLARAAVEATQARHARQRLRFAWVRTTLKPGENWKRRLPKVAW